MTDHIIDLSQFVSTVSEHRDDDQVIEQLRDLINDKYITTRPVSTPPIEFESGRYPLPFVPQLKKKVRHEFRRVYDTDQINIIIQNLLELHYLLWNQNITGFMIYSLIAAILQDEPINIIKNLIPDAALLKLPLNYDWRYDTLDSVIKLLKAHDDYIWKAINLIHPRRFMEKDELLQVNIRGFDSICSKNYSRSDCSQKVSKGIARRATAWDLLCRHWPIDVIQKFC